MIEGEGVPLANCRDQRLHLRVLDVDGAAAGAADQVVVVMDGIA